MRLRWGPHAGETTQQVLLRDPLYVVQVLSDQGDGVLARHFRDLVVLFDAIPTAEPCARCGRSSDGLCAYPGSIALFGFCEACVLISERAAPRPTHRILGYEDAVRHVALSFRRAHRINMRRIIAAIAASKGAPARLSEATAATFIASGDGRAGWRGHSPGARQAVSSSAALNAAAAAPLARAAVAAHLPPVR